MTPAIMTVIKRYFIRKAECNGEALGGYRRNVSAAHNNSASGIRYRVQAATDVRSRSVGNQSL